MALSTPHALESLSPPSTAPNPCAFGAAHAPGIQALTGTPPLPGRNGCEGPQPSEADAEGCLVPKPVQTLMMGGLGVVLVGVAVGGSGEDAWGKLLVAVGAMLYVIGRLFVWSLEGQPPRSIGDAALALESEGLGEETRRLHPALLGDHGVSAAWVLRPVHGRRRHQGQRARRALNALERAARFRAQRGAFDRLVQRVNPGSWWVV